jgi:3-hydroxyacyl-CoA dehydrogenase
MRLLEIVRGAATSAETLATALAFAKQIGKVGVVAGVCDGFIGNRLFEEYLRQAYYLLEEGALPWEVDQVMEDWGMAMGPFAVMDLAGNDIGWAIRKRRAIEHPERPYSRIPDRVCELGRFGQKTGAGFYRYDAATRRRAPDPEIEALILEHRRELGIEARLIPGSEVVARCVFALANEGARVLSEGIAYRASDIDVVYLNGYGFPRHRGGPMWYAQECGLAAVVDTIGTLRLGWHGECWEPAPLLLELAGRGASWPD